MSVSFTAKQKLMISSLSYDQKQDLEKEYRKKRKSTIISYLFLIIFWPFGGQRLYLGDIKRAIVLSCLNIGIFFLPYVNRYIDSIWQRNNITEIVWDFYYLACIVVVIAVVFITIMEIFLIPAVVEKKNDDLILNIASALLNLNPIKTSTNNMRTNEEIKVIKPTYQTDKTGNDEIDTLIKNTNDTTEKMLKITEKINNTYITKHINEISKTIEEIIEYIIKEPSKVNVAKRKLTYDLQYIVKLLGEYDELLNLTVKVEGVNQTLSSIKENIKLQSTNYNKALEDLYKQKLDDIDTEIKTQEYFEDM